MSRHQGPYAPAGSYYPEDIEAGTRRQSRPAYADYDDPYSNRRHHQHASLPVRSRFDSPSPSRHHSGRARAHSPPPRAYSPPPRRAYSPPPSRKHQARAHSPPPRAYSPPPRTRTYSPLRRRYDDDDADPRKSRESRGRRARSPDGDPYHRGDRDHRHSRSHPPPRHRSPPPSRRYHESPPPRRSASSRAQGDRHRSVPPHSGGGGRSKRSSSVGSPMLAAGLRTAIQAGAATAYKMRNDPSPWMGEKGTKVATAAIGAAIVDTFMNKRHPKKVGGVRHQAIRQATEMALGRGVVKPAVQARKRH